MEPSHGRTMLGPGKDPDLDQELDKKLFAKHSALIRNKEVKIATIEIENVRFCCQTKYNVLQDWIDSC